MWDSSLFVGALTPKFYVALTGTSSVISGLILIFEWWYFRKYGTSFIEQVSVSHLGPWLGGGGSNATVANTAAETDTSAGDSECSKVWRNPMSLLRGAEYARLWTKAQRAPLTYYDMNLSAQEHQAWFGAVGDGPAEEALGRAWREREPRARVAAAREALRHAPHTAAALLLLAEEDAPTVAEAERVLRTAWRAAEGCVRAGAGGGGGGGGVRREAAVLAHVKRRTAMCLRRLGRVRDAVRLLRELARDAPPALHNLNTHENLIEALLEQRAYPDVQAVLSRVDEHSACVVYTAALLRTRAALLQGAAQADALDALHRAIEYNPHVPEYLLELRALSLPPEHMMRRGESEALAYAFFHLRHWRATDGALRLLAAAWRAWGAAELANNARSRPPCVIRADRDLVAGRGAWGCAGGGARRAPCLLPLGAAVCAAAACLALLAHRWPSAAHAAARALRAQFDPNRAQETDV